MSTEIFTAIALPRAWVDGVGAHVSVFIAPRLVPDAADGETLAGFACFPDWVGALTHPTPRSCCATRPDPSRARARLEVTDASLWASIFPPSTPVSGPAAPDFSAPGMAQLRRGRGAGDRTRADHAGARSSRRSTRRSPRRCRPPAT